MNKHELIEWIVGIGIALFISAGLWATFTTDRITATTPACSQPAPAC